MARDSKGRFLPRLGRPIDPSAPGPTDEVVVPPSAGAEPDAWGVRTVSVGMAVDMDPAILVDAMTRAWLGHTRDALMTGQRPDGGGPQKALHGRALANPDRESPHRGYNTGELADGLHRTAITSDGRTASSRGLPPVTRTVYVATEAARGVVLVTGAGAAGEAAAAAARAAAPAMVSGHEVEHDDREVAAKDGGAA